ncbi:MAG: hypothetical protein IJJ50_03800 [Lachnospiraceae bacterium]|nr:hypothetical protein [Lachnospiraceae bacterium]
MQWVLIIGLSAIIFGIAIAVGNSRQKELMSEGKIVKRDYSFWENMEIFSTGIPYAAVLNAVRNTDYSDLKADVYPNVNGQAAVLWKSSHAWNAKLLYAGENAGRQIYRFSFTGWRTRNGSPYRPDTMNMMMTRIEKMILAMDPSATVETHKMQLKSRPRFL